MCVTMCVYFCMCVYVPWAGVSLYCPKIQAKGNVNGHTHNPASYGTHPPILFLCQACEGGTLGQAGVRVPQSSEIGGDLPSSQETQASSGEAPPTIAQTVTAQLLSHPQPVSLSPHRQGGRGGKETRHMVKPADPKAQGAGAGALPATRAERGWVVSQGPQCRDQSLSCPISPFPHNSPCRLSCPCPTLSVWLLSLVSPSPQP